MNKEISPEERLFNVIKAGKDPLRPSHTEEPSRPQGAAIEIPSPFTVQSWGGNIDFKKVNTVLTVLLFFLMGTVAFTVGHKKEISLKKLSEIPLVILQPINAAPAQTYQPVDYYLEQVKKRDLFHSPTVHKAPPVERAEASNKDFALSGIYMGQYPQAIITVKSEQKAYFLKEGDEIKGFKVKSILPNKVILQKGDQEIDLI